DVADRGAAVENARGELEQGCGGLLAEGLERRECVDRLGVEVARAGVDQVLQRRAWQRTADDRIQERGRDRIGVHLAMLSPGKRVAPPLQPDLAGERLAG